MRNAYAMNHYAEAKEALQKIFRQLERINPSAARSLEEGLEETPESVAPSAEGGPDSRSCLNLVVGRLTVPNIESRCNQLKLGHPLAAGVACPSLWFAKTLTDFEINDIAALPPLFCYNS
jgi:hypothetical protein